MTNPSAIHLLLLLPLLVIPEVMMMMMEKRVRDQADDEGDEELAG